jgi:hypothetical protein
MRSPSVFAVLAPTILIACGQSHSPLSPTPTVSVATSGAGSQMISTARKNTTTFAIHIFSATTGDYVDGALVTAVGSDGVPQSEETSPPHGHVDLDISKADETFDVYVTKEGYCPRHVVVTNEPPRWLWIGIQPEPGC